MDKTSEEMTTRYLRTSLATEFKEGRTLVERVIGSMCFFVPKANPGYEDRLHLVSEWVVEFDKNGLPGREIGLDQHGGVVLAGPNQEDYGFWLDTNMTYQDFTGESVSAETFEALWVKSEAYRNACGRA
ncbi:hypothetical protein [Mangrovitalea sediminis]|uniref:hypothetical protein n=1 Tax=Mangrovitalea sediminis TaxID=1982043 RepID=UPI0011781A4C|nr:hypothetical protein [Mangrovitalea sediminis]